MNNKLYHNAMEELVEEEFDRSKDSLECCQCPRCRGDIIAYALNKLPTKYVVTTQGALYSKVDTVVHVQMQTDILSALTQGAEIVRKFPRH